MWQGSEPPLAKKLVQRQYTLPSRIWSVEGGISQPLGESPGYRGEGLADCGC